MLVQVVTVALLLGNVGEVVDRRDAGDVQEIVAHCPDAPRVRTVKMWAGSTNGSRRT